MKKELDEQLCKDFPLLYKDRRGDKMKTLMCWGFPGSGWEPLIRELSVKLEDMIKKFMHDNPRGNCECNCSPDVHFLNTGKCMHTFTYPHSVKIPRYFLFSRGWPYQPKTLKDKLITFYRKAVFYTKLRPATFVQRMINKFLVLLHYFGASKTFVCPCEGYKQWHPSAMQVKEKYGTLCFYMTSSTDEMEDAISEAEAKSAVTCEDCGQPGVLRGGGWLRTLCDSCATEDGVVRKPYSEEEMF